MTASLSIYLGSYALGNSIDTFEVTQESRIDQVAIPRRHGYLSDTGYRAGLAIKIGGMIYNDAAADTRTELNNIKNAMSLGKFYLTIYDDRRIYVQKTYFSSSYEDQDLRRIRWEAELSADADGFEAVTQTVTTKTISATPQTDAFPTVGNLPSDSIIKISAGSVQIASGLRIDNLTSGKYFIFNRAIPVTTGYIEIDTDLLTVTDEGGVSRISSFSGDFFKLEVGANSIKWTGTATGSPTLRATFRDKYDGH